jgi:hypothetical protein
MGPHVAGTRREKNYIIPAIFFDICTEILGFGCLAVVSWQDESGRSSPVKYHVTMYHE